MIISGHRELWSPSASRNPFPDDHLNNEGRIWQSHHISLSGQDISGQKNL
ncbi:hypothetical protein B932_3707 (plasmid) [Gluconobacter oxydans H24]|nr:hypothetical protein B932_3707 [Gluconobacter oxydans H24]